MNSAQTANSALEDYARLLVDLHQLIARGLGDDPEADAVRDRMDSKWRAIDSKDIPIVRGLSSDLYSIGLDRSFDGFIPDGTHQEILLHARHGEFPTVLNILRREEDKLPPVYVAHWRGICWADMGVLVVATRFFAEASRLDPEQPLHRYFLLRTMIFSGQLDEAVPLARDAVTNDSMSELLFIASTILFLSMWNREPVSNHEEYRRIVEAVEKGNRNMKVNAPNAARKDAAVANVWRAIAYDQLEQAENAFAAANEAFTFDPGNEGVTKLRSLLSSGCNRIPEEQSMAIVMANVTKLNKDYVRASYSVAA